MTYNLFELHRCFGMPYIVTQNLGWRQIELHNARINTAFKVEAGVDIKIVVWLTCTLYLAYTNNIMSMRSIQIP